MSLFKANLGAWYSKVIKLELFGGFVVEPGASSPSIVATTPESPKADEEHGTVLEIDHVAEKKLVGKIDLNLITLFGALYLMSFLCETQI